MTVLMSARFLTVVFSVLALSLAFARADPPSTPVVWGKAVNGLEPGFLLTAPGPGTNRRVSLNSRVEYKVLVRNSSKQEIVMELHVSSAPYAIPDANIREALRSSSPPERFRAVAALDLSAAVGAYDVKLAPGEAVIVPGERGLYLGNADPQSLPRVESVPAGKIWIVQPISVHELTAIEKAEYARTNATPYSEKSVVTIVGREGTARAVSVPLVGARQKSKQLFAKAQIDVEARK